MISDADPVEWYRHNRPVQGYDFVEGQPWAACRRCGALVLDSDEWRNLHDGFHRQEGSDRTLRRAGPQDASEWDLHRQRWLSENPPTQDKPHPRVRMGR